MKAILCWMAAVMVAGAAVGATGVPVWVNTNTFNCLPLRSDGGTNNWNDMGGNSATGKVDKAGDFDQFTDLGGTSNQVYKSNGDGTGDWKDETASSGAATNSGYGWLVEPESGTGFNASLTAMNFKAPEYETTALCDVDHSSDYIALKTNGLWIITCVAIGTIASGERYALFAEASIDDGANYVQIGEFQSNNGAANNYTMSAQLAVLYNAASTNTERIRIRGYYSGAAWELTTGADGGESHCAGAYLGNIGP